MTTTTWDKPDLAEITDGAFKISVTDGLCHVVFDTPGEKVNKFTVSTMIELEQKVADLEQRARAGEFEAVLFSSAKKKIFIAGADLNEFGLIQTQAEAVEAATRGQAVFSRIEALPVPTAAAIEGTCVGGGLEFAMACTFRVASRVAGTQIGLPEVKLGIVPAWGGTQRLPRWVGLARAVEMITAGKFITPKQALRYGLVDALVPEGSAVAEATRLLQEAVSTGVVTASAGPFAPSGGRLSRRKPPQGWARWFLGSMVSGRYLLFDQARKAILKQTGGHYPAPLMALDCIQIGSFAGEEDGFAAEAKALARLVMSPTCKSLVSIFFLQDRLKKDPGLDSKQGKKALAREVERIGVLGAGAMGGGISQLAAYNLIPVRMRDINSDALARGMQEIGRLFDKAVQRRKLTRRERDNRLGLVTSGLQLDGFGACDFVIEAVIENLEIKQTVLKEAEDLLDKNAIIASNTSSLSIDAMASPLSRPQKFVGMHFFNPVYKMPLVEVIRGSKTSDETIATTVALTKRLGKIPIVVTDSPGFLVNRILMPFMNEAGLLVEQGYDFAAVDQALVDFGMPMGAFELLDSVGIDIASKVSVIFRKAFGDRVPDADVLHTMVEAGRLGKKSGKGFYLQRSRRKRVVDESVFRDLPAVARQRREPDPAEVVDRVILRMLIEAVMVLDEGVARSAEDVDAGMIFGTGFPPFTGGLMRYADGRGLQQIVERLAQLEACYGARFSAPETLLELARVGGQFRTR